MPKPTIEFTPISSFPLIAPPTGSTSLQSSSRVLSQDPTSGDKTLLLTHPPGQEWGGEDGREKQAKHVYWEECLILKGRMYDKTLGQWFSANNYCCRPPGMLHGPWIADPENGCEELVIIRYERS